MGSDKGLPMPENVPAAGTAGAVFSEYGAQKSFAGAQAADGAVDVPGPAKPVGGKLEEPTFIPARHATPFDRQNEHAGTPLCSRKTASHGSPAAAQTGLRYGKRIVSAENGGVAPTDAPGQCRSNIQLLNVHCLSVRQQPSARSCGPWQEPISFRVSGKPASAA